MVYLAYKMFKRLNKEGMKMEHLKLPGGNEMVSLPSIDAQSGGIEDVTFLHMGYKGLVDLRGPAGGASGGAAAPTPSGDGGLFG